MKHCSIEEFRAALDNYLAKIPDKPKIPGYDPTASDQFGGQPSNSLLDQMRKLIKTTTGVDGMSTPFRKSVDFNQTSGI